MNMDLDNIMPRIKRKCVMPPIVEIDDDDVVTKKKKYAAPPSKKAKKKHTRVFPKKARKKKRYTAAATAAATAAPTAPSSSPSQSALTAADEEAIDSALAQITDEEAMQAMIITDEEKIVIAEAVNNFSEEDMVWVFKLLRLNDEEEVEIDLETLDVMTMRMLHSFVCMTPEERAVRRG